MSCVMIIYERKLAWCSILPYTVVYCHAKSKGSISYWLCRALKHTTTLFSLSDHDILSRERRVIVDQVQTNYHGRPVVGLSVRCDRSVDYEGYSLWSDVF